MKNISVKFTRKMYRRVLIYWYFSHAINVRTRTFKSVCHSNNVANGNNSCIKKATYTHFDAILCYNVKHKYKCLNLQSIFFLFAMESMSRKAKVYRLNVCVCNCCCFSICTVLGLQVSAKQITVRKFS